MGYRKRSKTYYEQEKSKMLATWISRLQSHQSNDEVTPAYCVMIWQMLDIITSIVFLRMTIPEIIQGKTQHIPSCLVYHSML